MDKNCSISRTSCLASVVLHNKGAYCCSLWQPRGQGMQGGGSLLPSVAQLLWSLSVTGAPPAEFLPKRAGREDSGHGAGKGMESESSCRREANGAGPLVSNKELLPPSFSLDWFWLHWFHWLMCLWAGNTFLPELHLLSLSSILQELLRKLEGVSRAPRSTTTRPLLLTPSSTDKRRRNRQCYHIAHEILNPINHFEQQLGNMPKKKKITKISGSLDCFHF